MRALTLESSTTITLHIHWYSSGNGMVSSKLIFDLIFPLACSGWDRIQKSLLLNKVYLTWLSNTWIPFQAWRLSFADRMLRRAGRKSHSDIDNWAWTKSVNTASSRLERCRNNKWLRGTVTYFKISFMTFNMGCGMESLSLLYKLKSAV